MAYRRTHLLGESGPIGPYATGYGAPKGGGVTGWLTNLFKGIKVTPPTISVPQIQLPSSIPLPGGGGITFGQQQANPGGGMPDWVLPALAGVALIMVLPRLAGGGSRAPRRQG